MQLISTKDKLPQDNQTVLIHLTKTNWGNNPDWYWVTATFRKGLSLADRANLPNSDERKRTYSFGDEYGNNTVPYEWSGHGPCNYFGQEVDYWCELPKLITPLEIGDWIYDIPYSRFYQIIELTDTHVATHTFILDRKAINGIDYKKWTPEIGEYCIMRSEPSTDCYAFTVQKWDGRNKWKPDPYQGQLPNFILED